MYIFRPFPSNSFYRYRYIFSETIYRICLKSLYKHRGRFLHSKTIRKVHINMGPQTLHFRVTAQQSIPWSTDIPSLSCYYCRAARPVHILFDLQTCSYATISVTDFCPASTVDLCLSCVHRRMCRSREAVSIVPLTQRIWETGQAKRQSRKNKILLLYPIKIRLSSAVKVKSIYNTAHVTTA
jgi:hypothetical protein